MSVKRKAGVAFTINTNAASNQPSTATHSSSTTLSPKELDAYKERSTATVIHIMRDASVTDVTRRLALQLFIDPELVAQFGNFWSKNLAVVGAKSMEAEICEQLAVLLCAPIRLSLTTYDDQEGWIYLFDAEEQPTFGLPMALFKSNFVALACIQRVHASSCARDSQAVFSGVEVDQLAGVMRLTRFQHNRLLENSMQRSVLAVALLESYCAAASTHDNNPQIEQPTPAPSFSEATRLVCLAAVRRLLTTRAKQANVGRGGVPQMKSEDVARMREVESLLSESARYSCDQMLVLLLKFSHAGMRRHPPAESHSLQPT